MTDTGAPRIRALIVDDEPIARRGLRAMLAASPQVDVVGEAANGVDALAAVRELAPQLVFLDIQLPDLDGFSVLSGMPPDQAPAIVFVTAYEQYALPAFEANAVDYLLKPFDAARLARSLRRVSLFLAGSEGPAPNESRDHEQRAVEWAGRERRFVVKGRSGILFLEPEDVDWIESWGNYVRLFAAGRAYLLRETTAAVESRLDASRFLRISRSVIVNVERVRSLSPKANGQVDVVLASGVTLHASRRFRARLQRFFGLR
jgi:two-component system, LytTR family, response regulator